MVGVGLILIGIALLEMAKAHDETERYVQNLQLPRAVVRKDRP